MVHRQVGLPRPRTALLLAALATLLPAALAAPSADAANRRISLSNYSWSATPVHVDLGEHVTWYWIGPDLMHSITGVSPNAVQWDSDPQTNQPQHRLGDTYQVSFDKPGVYEFRCKLHSLVRGEVVVSDRPGDPNAEPDPVPRSAVDVTPPRMRQVRLKRRVLGRKGTSLGFTLNERGRIDAEYWRYKPKKRRRGGRIRWSKRKRFQGWAAWKAHVGYNHVRFGTRRKHFRPRPGRYVAELRATDRANNTSRPKRVRFTIRRR